MMMLLLRICINGFLKCRESTQRWFDNGKNEMNKMRCRRFALYALSLMNRLNFNGRYGSAVTSEQNRSLQEDDVEVRLGKQLSQFLIHYSVSLSFLCFIIGPSLFMFCGRRG